MPENLSGNAQKNISVEIEDDRCGKCMVCPSVCPFEAISIDENSKVKLDLEKCQVCGICSSACPASAIETVYYNVESLLSYIGRAMHKKGSDKLLLMCRGTNPFSETLKDDLKKLRVDSFVSISFPCVGRVPPELLLRALALGVKRTVVVPCENAFCRFEKGSEVGTRRLLLTQAVLRQLGFKPDTLNIIKRSIKASIDGNRCIGCGNCMYVCPYDAIRMDLPGVALVDAKVCSGCGTCVAVCPALAIKLEGFEHDDISKVIRKYGMLIPSMKKRTNRPAVLVLCCQWSEFSALDVNRTRGSKNIVFVGLPCAGNADTLHILEAFHSGFDGVLVAACNKSECKLEGGNDEAEQRVNSLKKALAEVNLEKNLDICFVSPRNVGDLEHNIEQFVNRLDLPSIKEVA